MVRMAQRPRSPPPVPPRPPRRQLLLPQPHRPQRRQRLLPQQHLVVTAASRPLRSPSGSRAGGRIIKADVERAHAAGVAAPPEAPAAPAAPAPAPTPTGPTPGVSEKPETAKGQVEVVELTKLQQTVARRMAESKATAPHFYLQAEFDLTAAVDGRKRLKAMAKEPRRRYSSARYLADDLRRWLGG